MSPLELARTTTEIGARQVWFRLSEQARARLGGLARGRPAAPPTLDIQGLHARLRELAPGPAPLLMVHASTDGFSVPAEDGSALPAARGALAVLHALFEHVGDDGTLCMPTHPLYKGDRAFLDDKDDLRLTYKPARTPSSVGLLSELFRRDADTQRSRHPLCSLAARGPLAEALLRDNLNGRAPLPHGVDSGYHRFCQREGTVVGIGLRLLPFATVLHCAEEVADDTWPVPGFFRPRTFVVEDEAGEREVHVRERRPEFVRSLALGRLRRDALAEGILRESALGGVPLDVLDAHGLFEMMVARQQRGPYPFFLPRLAAWGTGPPPVAAME